MTDQDGGHTVPPEFIDKVLERQGQANPFWTNRAPFPPLTLRQRLRVRWWDAKWAIHDALFPSCRSDEDY